MDYIELAHSTSAPVEDAQNRLAGDFKLLALLFAMSEKAIEASADMDIAKRAIFYGKTDSSCFSISRDELASASEAIKDPVVVELIHAAIGLVTEAGEFLSMVHSHVFEDGPLDTTNLKEEIGDNQWYIAKACKFTGTTLELEQNRNIAKLATRFPQKFTNADALQRDLVAERNVLEMDVPLGMSSEKP